MTKTGTTIRYPFLNLMYELFGMSYCIKRITDNTCVIRQFEFVNGNPLCVIRQCSIPNNLCGIGKVE